MTSSLHRSHSSSAVDARRCTDSTTNRLPDIAVGRLSGTDGIGTRGTVPAGYRLARLFNRLSGCLYLLKNGWHSLFISCFFSSHNQPTDRQSPPVLFQSLVNRPAEACPRPAAATPQFPNGVDRPARLPICRPIPSVPFRCCRSVVLDEGSHSRVPHPARSGTRLAPSRGIPSSSCMFHVPLQRGTCACAGGAGRGSGTKRGKRSFDAARWEVSCSGRVQLRD